MAHTPEAQTRTRSGAIHARAATWSPVIDDVITGGVRSELRTTPMSKLDLRMTGLARNGSATEVLLSSTAS
jgi:hypothetical protein